MKLYILISLLTITLLTGCSLNNQQNQDTPIMLDQEAQDTTQLILQDYSFSLPDGWIANAKNKELSTINVLDPKYDVQLPVTMTENLTTDLTEPAIYETENLSVYIDACGGATACYLVQDSAKNKVYSLIFEMVRSSEPAPKDIDGVWVPNTAVNSEVIEQIVKTIK